MTGNPVLYAYNMKSPAIDVQRKTHFYNMYTFENSTYVYIRVGEEVIAQFGLTVGWLNYMVGK